MKTLSREIILLHIMNRQLIERKNTRNLIIFLKRKMIHLHFKAELSINPHQVITRK
jgi:hypothetical protein